MNDVRVIPERWKTIRLELARTADFPEGSPGRAYLVRLPLDGNGMIDENERAAAPAMATVRRFWPNERDMSGYVVHTPTGWAFSYGVGEEVDGNVFHLESHPILIGEYITLTEPDGSRLPFRVASVRDLRR